MYVCEREKEREKKRVNEHKERESWSGKHLWIVRNRNSETVTKWSGKSGWGWERNIEWKRENVCMCVRMHVYVYMHVCVCVCVCMCVCDDMTYVCREFGFGPIDCPVRFILFEHGKVKVWVLDRTNKVVVYIKKSKTDEGKAGKGERMIRKQIDEKAIKERLVDWQVFPKTDTELTGCCLLSFGTHILACLQCLSFLNGYLSNYWIGV